MRDGDRIDFEPLRFAIEIDDTDTFRLINAAEKSGFRLADLTILH